MNGKAEKWQTFVKENKINAFTMEEVNNDLHPVLFRSNFDTDGVRLPLMLVLDDSIYTMFQVLVARKAVTPENKAALEELLNSYNKQFKVFKYYTNDEGDICLDTCIPSTVDSFDPVIIRSVIDVVLKHLQEKYAEIMKLVWNKLEIKGN